MKPWNTGHLLQCECFVVHIKHYDAISVFCFKITSTFTYIITNHKSEQWTIKGTSSVIFSPPYIMHNWSTTHDTGSQLYLGYLADGGFKKQDPKTYTTLEIIKRII